MASDVYLHIDGVSGESTDGHHAEWIELHAVSWSGMQPKSATASTAGGHTAERVELSEISCSKLIDLTSPKLFQLMCEGKTIPAARIEFMRADDHRAISYYVLELENVLICQCSRTYPGSGLLLESLGLRFSRITEKYTRQRIAGGVAGNILGSWNLASNRPR